MKIIEYFNISKEQLKLDKLINKISSPEIGGIVTFIGTVRNNSDNKTHCWD